MGEEAVVLNGHLGGLHLLGDLRQRDVLAVLVVEGGQYRPICHEDVGLLGLRGTHQFRRQVIHAVSHHRRGATGQSSDGHDESGYQQSGQDADDSEHGQGVELAVPV